MNRRAFSVVLLLLAAFACKSAPPLTEGEIAANKAKSKQSFTLALQRSKEGKKDSAEALFREAVELDPENLERHIGLAGFLGRTGRSGDAFAIYKNALAKFGERPEIYEEMAFAHNEAGDTDAAVSALHKAVELRSKMPNTPENAQWIQRDQEGIKGLTGGK